MPRRSNDFQHLVALIEAQLAPGAEVSESKLLRDRVTGEEREVDIYVVHRLGEREIRVGIECRDHARPADVLWIEQLHAKMSTLPVERPRRRGGLARIRR